MDFEDRLRVALAAAGAGQAPPEFAPGDYSLVLTVPCDMPADALPEMIGALRAFAHALLLPDVTVEAGSRSLTLRFRVPESRVRCRDGEKRR